MARSASSVQIEKEDILALLTDAEVGKVATAETKTSLASGEQYVDLDDLSAGVQTAHGGPAPHVHDLIVRSSVGGKTWAAIVDRLKAG
ncbi:MAG: hypothetical protein KDJ17_05035 [Hyphomicrobiaceae bacterium]|nr:hypothetical protein [Hyphomicrobiaceae bacterium]